MYGALCSLCTDNRGGFLKPLLLEIRENQPRALAREYLGKGSPDSSSGPRHQDEPVSKAFCHTIVYPCPDPGLIHSQHAVFCEGFNDEIRALHGRELAGIDMNLRCLRRLIRRIDTGEVLQSSRSRLLVQAFDIAF